jgi:hypothetical protein
MPDTDVTEAMLQINAPLNGQAEPERLGRNAAIDLIGRLKATIVTGAFVALGVFAGLAATHITGVTSRANTSSSNSQGTTAAPTTTSNADDSGGFFNQGPNNGFGVGQPGAQGPAAGSSVS